MRFFKRGETVDSKFTFLDSNDGQPIDIINGVYSISHYDGPTEIIDVASTSLQHATNTGEYIVNWLIPNTAPENETYFVKAQGEHPDDHTITVIEDFYRVLPASFFDGGAGGGTCGLVIKFTKP
jgi:hypothetical protein